MIRNAVTSTRNQLLASSVNLYTELSNVYDNSVSSFRYYLDNDYRGGGGSGGIGSGGYPNPIHTLPPVNTVAPKPTITPTIRPTLRPTLKPTVRPVRPIIPFPEIAIGYIINDKPTLDWDVFKTYDIPDSNRYVEYDSYAYRFNTFDKIENATAYWTDYLQDKTVVDNSIIRLEQKQSNKLWNFYSYNIDNSYISKMFDDMYASFTNVRRFDEKSQNIIKSFDQYTEKIDLIAFEFEGMSEFDVNYVQVENSASKDYTQGKIRINTKHKRLKNLDYYVTATNGVHVDYDGTIYFSNNDISYITAYLSTDPSNYKTIAVKPTHVSYIPNQQDISKGKAYSCLKCYNAHKMLKPLSVLTTTSTIDFSETYNDSIILYNDAWNLVNESSKKQDVYYADIELNIGGIFIGCTTPSPAIRKDDFRSVGLQSQSRLYISGNVSIIDDKHVRLNLSALGLTARQFNSSSSYKVTLYKYNKTIKDEKLIEEKKILQTFDLFLSSKQLYPTGLLRPKMRLVYPLKFTYNGITNSSNNTLKIKQNSTVIVESSASENKLLSISVEPANGNATSLVPKVKRINDTQFKIFAIGKGSYKINYTIKYNNINGTYDDSGSYSMIIDDSGRIYKQLNQNIKNDSLTQYKVIDESNPDKAKFGVKIPISFNQKINETQVLITPPASVIGQFNTFCEEARSITNKFSSEASIDYIYTDYEYTESGINATVWYYGEAKFACVAPLRIYLINVDNSISYVDFKDKYDVKSSSTYSLRKVSARMLFIGIIDDFTDYAKDLSQELYAISKQNKISGFIKISLGLSDKPWTQSAIKVKTTPILDPWITNLQNKYVAKFTPKQVSYLTTLNKRITSIADKSYCVSQYLASQKLEPLNTSYVLGKNINLSTISYISNKKQINNSYIFDTPALGLSKIIEDTDVLSPWNVSPQITIDNPTIWYDLNEYFGKIKRGCMYSTTEKNYDLDIRKNSQFDTEMESVAIYVNISKTDKIKIEFSFEMIYAMLNSKKEEIYCIDENSLKIDGTLEGKRVMLKYVNGCSWNKTTGKVTIGDGKSFNLVFSVLNSRKRINLTFVIDEYYQVLDDIVVEGYDAPCFNGDPLKIEDGGIELSTLSSYIALKTEGTDNSTIVNNIKESLIKDKYSYSHVWLKDADLAAYCGLKTAYVSILGINVPKMTNVISNNSYSYSFGTLSLKNNQLVFERNYLVEDYTKLIKPIKFPLTIKERFVSNENIKWLISKARQLNLLEDHDYNICLNVSKHSENDCILDTHIKTEKYIIKILCKNKLITIASGIKIYEPFEFNYKKYCDKYGFITALSIFDGNDELVKTFMLNTSFLPYTKATIILERIHQTPIYYFNDALSEYKENGDYDNLLPSFAFYRDTQEGTLEEIENDVNRPFSKFGLISRLTINNSTIQNTLENYVPKMSLAVVDNKVASFQQISNTVYKDISYITIENPIIKPVLVNDEYKFKTTELTNKLILKGQEIKSKEEYDKLNIETKNQFEKFIENEKELFLGPIKYYQPNTMQYIGYLMYYYNMLYLRNLGWTMNDDNDSEDMIYYMIMLDKLKNTAPTFSEFRSNLFNHTDHSAKYGNQIDIYETVAKDNLQWKSTIGYLEYFNRYYDNIIKYWEDRIEAYNMLEGVLGEYDSRLTVIEQIDKYLDYIGDDGSKREKIYFILTTTNHQDNWLVSQINNRIYQQDAFYYVWSNVYQILFDGIFDFDLINDAIVSDIYNYGLYPEIEIPEMTNEGLFKPYKINKNGKIEESLVSNGLYEWDGSDEEKYKYILDENNFIKGIDADITVDDFDNIWTFTKTSNDSSWDTCYIAPLSDGKYVDGIWGILKDKDGNDCVLTIKGKINKRKGEHRNQILHSKTEYSKTGLNGETIKYITIKRKLNKDKKQSKVHATYFGDCKEYWLDDSKTNIIKTNKRSLITGIRLQRFLCELFISELNKSMAMVNVIQKFFEINDSLKKMRSDWRKILQSDEFNINNIFDREIKYPLYDFNLKEFTFERNCIYPEDTTLRGILSYSFDYYSWNDHKILSKNNSDALSISIPRTNIVKQIVHDKQIYDDLLTLNISIPQNISTIKRKGITETQISYNWITQPDNSFATYFISIIPEESLGIEPFGIYPWNINKDSSMQHDTTHNDNDITAYMINPAIWSSSITDISGLPNFTNYDNISKYIDVDTNGLLNTDIIMKRVRSGELENAPAVELCYNFIPEEFISLTNTTTSAYIYTYNQTFTTGHLFDRNYSRYNRWSYFINEKNIVSNNDIDDILGYDLSLSSYKTNSTNNNYVRVINIADNDINKFPFTYVKKTDPVNSSNNKNGRITLNSSCTYTYTYGYILSDISYEVTAYYILSNEKTVTRYYNSLNVQTKEEVKLTGTVTKLNDILYSISAEKNPNTGVAVEASDAPIVMSSKAKMTALQPTTPNNLSKNLSFSINRLDDLMVLDDGIYNSTGGGGGGRVNNRYKGIEVIDDIKINTDEPLPIPPIITRELPTVRPLPTIEPTVKLIDINEKPDIFRNIKHISDSCEINSIYISYGGNTDIHKKNDIIGEVSKNENGTISGTGIAYHLGITTEFMNNYVKLNHKDIIEEDKINDNPITEKLRIALRGFWDKIIDRYISEFLLKDINNNCTVTINYSFNGGKIANNNYNNFYKMLVIDNQVKLNSKKALTLSQIRQTFGFFLGSVSQWQIVQDNVLTINSYLREIDKLLNPDMYKNNNASYDYIINPSNRKYPEPDYFYEGRYNDNKYSNRLFWTSSEIDKDEAWIMFFDQYYCGLNNKMTSAYIRPFITVDKSRANIE